MTDVEMARFCDEHAEDPWDSQSFGVLPWGGGTAETCPDCRRYGA